MPVSVTPQRLARTTEGKLDSPILSEGDNGFFGFATRPNPITLPEGVAQSVSNGRLDRGVFKTRSGIKQVSANIILAEPPLILDSDDDDPLDRLLLSPVSISSLSRSTTTATCVTAAVHNLITGNTVEIAGCTNNTNFNGDFVVTVTNTTTFTYTMTAAGATTASGTMTSTHRRILKNNYTDGIFGSGVWSDPSRNSHNREYLVLVSGSKAFFFSERDENLAVLSEVDYGGGEAIKQVDEVSVMQAFQRLLVFRGSSRNKPILEWNGDFTTTLDNKATTGAVDLNCPSASYGAFFRNRLVVPREVHNMSVPAAAGITRSSTTATVSTTTPHNIYDGEEIQISGSNNSAFNGDFIASKITGKLNGSITGSASLTTITLASTTGFPTSGTNYISVEGEVMTYTGVSSNDLTGVSRGAFAVSHGNQSEVELLSAFTCTVAASGSADTSGGAIVTKRVRDEVFASDILDTDNFNPYGLFRISKGTNDRVVAFHPYDVDSLIVFCRHSIHRIIGLTDVDTAKVELITDEVGCVAPRSVQRVGGDIFFLAHNGVHSLKLVGSNLRLMGADVPLSESIDPTIKTINMDWAEDRQQGVVSAFHDNRYWLAYSTGKGADVRINQSSGALTNSGIEILAGGSGYSPANGQIPLKITGGNGNGDAVAHVNVVDGVITSAEVTVGGASYDGTERVQVPARNDKVLIYNVLNKQWESIDSYGSDNVFIDNLVRMTWKGETRLFATSFEGGVYLFDEGTVDQFGMAGTSSLSSTEIQSQIKTRQYMFGFNGIKKYLRAQVESNFPSGTGEVTMTPASENTDATGETTTISSAQTGEKDLTSRIRLGRLRGRALELTFDGKAGQPEIRGVSAEATMTSRITTSYE